MIGFSKGICRLCGKEDSLNEGICAAHSSDAAQGYLFGYEDGRKSALEPKPEVDLSKVREALDFCKHCIADLRGYLDPDHEDLQPYAWDAIRRAEEALAILAAHQEGKP